MKYRWYYIEVFRDAKECFEKQKTAGAEIPSRVFWRALLSIWISVTAWVKKNSMSRIRLGDTGWRAAVVTVISVPICTGY